MQSDLKEKQPRSGTLLLIGLVVLIVGLLAAANLRLRAHRKQPDSLAVLPFLSGSQDPEAAPLCKEITRDIIRNLSSIPHLSVISETRVLAYQGPVLSLQKAGHELNVDVVVVGRVERKQNTVIIQTDLVNVADESQLWGKQYERRFSDSLSADIAQDISDNVRHALFPQK